MIRNYVKVALRSLLSHKLHSFITIAGLAFAMSQNLSPAIHGPQSS